MIRPTSRRGFLLGSAGLAGAAVAAQAASAQASGTPRGAKSPLPEKTYDLKLGVCSYSFREFGRNLALKMTRACGTRYINLKEFHLPYTLSADELKKARAQIEKAGFTIAGGGTIYLQKDDDDDMRHYFDYAKNAGMPVMVIGATKQTVPRIEKFVKEYDIQAALHNHGPEDRNFPSPYDVLEAVKGMDPRMGLCMDLGHSMRTGADVVKACADAGSRLLDVHIKDLADPKSAGSQCDVGEGVMPVVALFRQLKKMNYQGYVNLEYEINGYEPLVGMQKSFAYMHGVLDALKG
jgi:sugar phosphate isomerase/epimerase